MAAGTWFAEAKRVPVAAVAEALGGFTLARGALAPCPACGAERRGSEDRRGPVLARAGGGLGWRCVCCQGSGNGLDLAALVLTGDKRPPPDRWPEVRAWFAALGWCEPEAGQGAPVAPVARRAPPPVPVAPEAPGRLPVAEVVGLWEAADAVSTQTEGRRWTVARGMHGIRAHSLNLARALAYDTPLPDWARFKGKTWIEAGYRVIFPLYDAAGSMAGVVARWSETRWDDAASAWVQVTPPPGWPKSLNPPRSSPRGLAFADPFGALLLKWGPTARAGDADPDATAVAWDGTLYLVEGPTDLMKLATQDDRLTCAGEGYYITPAILAYVQGSWDESLARRIPPWTDVTVIPDTDPNGAGERMAAAVVATLGHLTRPPVVLSPTEISKETPR